MAIKAIIATQFDATGIKKASKEFDKLGKTLRSTLGAVGLTVGLAAITNGLKEATKAAAMDAKSQGLLAQQLQNTVNATDSVIASNEAFINSLQRTTAIADDDLRPAMSALVRATGDVDKAQSLLALSTDIAAGTGRDLGSVAIAVGRAANGQTTALRRLGIVVKAGEDPIKALTTAFAGNAEAAANLDPFQRLTTLFGEIQEQIGFALLPTLQDFANWFASPEGSEQVQKFVDLLVDGATGLANFAKYVSDNISFLGPLATGIGIATVAFGIFNAVVAANPFVAAAYGLGLVIAGLVAVGGEAYKAKVEFEKLNGAQTRFGGGILDRQKAAEKAAKNAMPEIIASNYGIGAGGSVIGRADKSTVKVEPFVDLTKNTKALKTATDTLKKSADEAQKLIDAQDKLVADFTENITDLSKAFRGLGESSKELGQFEQQASSAFDALNEQIKKGLNDRAITQAAAKYLTDYVAVERAALTALARQRDVLLSRIAIAQDISRGVINAVNITGLLTNETRQVTKSVKTLVNGIATTISSTYDEVITGNLADSFKKLVDRTKNFAKNLITLKKLGLNGTLFKQIVDAGSEAGGATAEAIIAGGADTVSELNGLFDELNKAGSDIAAESTDVFYNLGEGVSNAFIDGLKSQEAILAAQIASMVASIEAAFASMMARLNQLGAAPMTNANGFAYETALPGVSGSAMQFGSATPWAQAVASFRESQTPTVNNYITVKAGAIVAEKSAGQLITSLQNKYTKASG
jgi:hypothetical protein